MLYFQDRLLAKIDHQLPLARHVIAIPYDIVLNRRPVIIEFMWPQEVVVGDPEREVIRSSIIVVKAIGRAVGSFISSVQAFDHLLIGPEFFGDSIIVLEADDLGDIEFKLVTELMEELLCSQRIGAVAVSDEPEAFRKLFKVLESHPHCYDTRPDTTVVRETITDNGTGCGVHNKPDVSGDAADFDIGFIRNEHRVFLVMISIYERLDADCGRTAVIRDLLMRDRDTIKVFESLRGFAQRQAKVNVKGKAQGHDISIVLSEFQGRDVLGQSRQIQLKEIDRELTVDVMELIFVLTVVFRKVRFVNILQVMQVERTPGVHAFVDHEMLAVFLMDKGMGTVRTRESQNF